MSSSSSLLLDFSKKQVPIEKLLKDKNEGFDCLEPAVTDSSKKVSSVIKKSKIKVPINDDVDDSPRVQSSSMPLKSTKSTPKKTSEIIDLSLDD